MLSTLLTLLCEHVSPDLCACSNLPYAPSFCADRGEGSSGQLLVRIISSSSRELPVRYPHSQPIPLVLWRVCVEVPWAALPKTLVDRSSSQDPPSNNVELTDISDLSQDRLCSYSKVY